SFRSAKKFRQETGLCSWTPCKPEPRTEVVLVQLLNPAAKRRLIGATHAGDYDTVQQISASVHERRACRVSAFRRVCLIEALREERGEHVLRIKRHAIELIANAVVELKVSPDLPGILTVKLDTPKPQLICYIELRLAVCACEPEQKIRQPYSA